MTIKEAAEIVRRYDTHMWAYEVADDGTVVVGGNNHQYAIWHARDRGHYGPILHLYEVGEYTR